jgi:putative hydrolase of the HAD superfamily
MARPDALILDYGEVLSLPQHPDAIARMAAQLDVPTERFAQAYWRHRRSYDLGLPAHEYWQRVASELSIDGNPPAEDLIAIDVASWMSFRDEMWQLAAEARAAGIRTAVLSNGIREVLAQLDIERPLSAHFDVVVISYAVGCAKPDPLIYQIASASRQRTPCSSTTAQRTSRVRGGWASIRCISRRRSGLTS